MANKVKDRRLRMLWNSNGVWTNSGYAVEQRELLYRMIEDGWETAQSAFWGLEGYPITLDGEFAGFPGKKLKVYPKMGDAWGADAMLWHGQDFGANVVFCMQDVWTLNPEVLSKFKYFIPWVPIDKDPVPPAVLDKLRYAYKILTFSQFGKDALEKAGFTSTLILEGTNTKLMTPLNKMKCREELGLPQDAFFFGMIAANKENPPRKGFQEALEAFKLFHDKHPEAAILFHTQQMAPTGFPIKEFADHLGIANRMFFIPEYVAIWKSDSNVIKKEMGAIDCLLHPSQTEGFGLTVVEAMSCGRPAIVSNTTSMPEMMIPGKTGEICDVSVKRFTSDSSFVWAADVNSLYEKMESVYKMVKDNPEKVEKDCRDHVLNKYDIDKIFKNKWIPFLEELQEEILGKPVKS